ncbi:hypothetical protein SV7mr_10560 [Stieleria bergensis]|uniref:Uncharacterized protein n=1 Tax=Stieleria bergensis TaxID=2528025 RepID=A0A517SR50_9BACT|nr:hypothetical protein SV7mr_10560 [Planctomycetes bacterium SV_7m_r]
MNEVSLLQSLGQVSASETGIVFRDFLRGQLREMICEVMAAEVPGLCSPKHAPSSSGHCRAGSASGLIGLGLSPVLNASSVRMPERRRCSTP